MKKLILGLLLFSISLLGYSQNSIEQTASNVADVKEAVDAVKQATTQVNPTVVYFTEKLQELAKSLKVPAEHVYRVLVQKEHIGAYSQLFLLLFSFLIGTIILVVTIKSYNNKNDKWRISNPTDYRVKEDEEYNHYDLENGWWMVGVIISISILALTLLIAVIAGSDIVIGIINPEYGAIKEIMQLF